MLGQTFRFLRVGPVIAVIATGFGFQFAVTGALASQRLLPALPMPTLNQPSSRSAQQSGNSPDGNSEAVRRGARIFQTRCADCHGLDARGVRAPDLTRLWASDNADERFFQIIRRGLPGTEMPRFGDSLPDNDIRAVLAYLRTLNTVASSAPVAGNIDNGARIFQSTCVGCHRVNGRGGRLGPDLSRIGATRSRDGLAQKVRQASSYLVPGYASVTLVTRKGERIRGIKMNEDNFSIQIMDTRERLLGFEKAKLTELTNDTKSLMPDFGPERLRTADLDDVVAYLGSLRERDPNIR